MHIIMLYELTINLFDSHLHCVLTCFCTFEQFGPALFANDTVHGLEHRPILQHHAFAVWLIVLSSNIKNSTQEFSLISSANSIAINLQSFDPSELLRHQLQI